jgi:hypothetical protein
MNRQVPLAIVLAAAFALPHAAAAATVVVHPHKMHKVINSRRPGSPGFTGSSPLGSAQKAVKRANKKVAKQSHPAAG